MDPELLGLIVMFIVMLPLGLLSLLVIGMATLMWFIGTIDNFFTSFNNLNKKHGIKAFFNVIPGTVVCMKCGLRQSNDTRGYKKKNCENISCNEVVIISFD